MKKLLSSCFSLVACATDSFRGFCLVSSGFFFGFCGFLSRVFPVCDSRPCTPKFFHSTCLAFKCRPSSLGKFSWGFPPRSILIWNSFPQIEFSMGHNSQFISAIIWSREKVCVSFSGLPLFFHCVPGKFTTLLPEFSWALFDFPPLTFVLPLKSSVFIIQPLLFSISIEILPATT